MLRTRDMICLALAVVCIGGSLVVAVLAAGLSELEASEAPVRFAPAVVLPEKPSGAAQPPDLSDFGIVTTRPLFAPERKIVIENPTPKPVLKTVVKPPEKIPPPPPPPPVKEFKIQLIGIVVLDGIPSALVTLPGAQKIHRLRMGEELDGWLLDEIKGKSVAFSHKQKSRVLSLEKRKTD